MDEIEENGLVFTPVSENNKQWTILDLNYGCSIGRLCLEQGPGWILDQFGTKFLDLGQMSTIIQFTKDIDAGMVTNET